MNECSVVRDLIDRVKEDDKTLLYGMLVREYFWNAKNVYVTQQSLSDEIQ